MEGRARGMLQSRFGPGFCLKGGSSTGAPDSSFFHLLFFFFNRCSLSDGSTPRWTICLTAGTVCFTVTGTDWVLMSHNREQDCRYHVQMCSRIGFLLTELRTYQNTEVPVLSQDLGEEQ